MILALLFPDFEDYLGRDSGQKNPFNSMMALGIGGMILMQTFINIGGISGLIPSKGNLPFPIARKQSSGLVSSHRLGT